VPRESQLTLRDYNPEDFEALLEIDQQCYPLEVAYSREDFQEYLRFPGSDCVIACDAARPIGFCLTAHRLGHGYIITIDVLESHRRHGAGSLLLQESESRLAARGVRTVRLETATENGPAIAFWQKHGYRTRGLKPGYYPGGRDAYSMVKILGTNEPAWRPAEKRR